MSDTNHEAKTQKKRRKPGNWKKPEKPNPDKGVCVYARVSVSDSSYITSFELQKRALQDDRILTKSVLEQAHGQIEKRDLIDE